MLIKVKGNDIYISINRLNSSSYELFLSDLVTLNRVIEVLPYSSENITIDLHDRYMIKNMIKSYKDTSNFNSCAQKHIHFQFTYSELDCIRVSQFLECLPSTYSPYFYINFSNCKIHEFYIDYSLSKLVVINSEITSIFKDDSYIKANIIDSKVSILSNFFCLFYDQEVDMSRNIQLSAEIGYGNDTEIRNKDSIDLPTVYVEKFDIEDIVIPSEFYVSNSTVTVYNNLFSIYNIYKGTFDLREKTFIGNAVDYPDGYVYVPKDAIEYAISL